MGKSLSLDQLRVQQYKEPTAKAYEGWEVGMKVQLKEGQISYGYADRPPYNAVGVMPNAVGVIGAVKVPYVSGAYKLRGDYPYFVCVDFMIGDERHRVGASYKNIKHANTD